MFGFVVTSEIIRAKVSPRRCPHFFNTIIIGSRDRTSGYSQVRIHPFFKFQLICEKNAIGWWYLYSYISEVYLEVHRTCLIIDQIGDVTGVYCLFLLWPKIFHASH